MIGAISSIQSQGAAEASATSQGSTQPQPAAKGGGSVAAAKVLNDRVTISAAAQAMLQELHETSAQTAKEAAAGDHQAQRLLAKEAAERAQ